MCLSSSILPNRTPLLRKTLATSARGLRSPVFMMLHASTFFSSSLRPGITQHRPRPLALSWLEDAMTPLCAPSPSCRKLHAATLFKLVPTRLSQPITAPILPASSRHDGSSSNTLSITAIVGRPSIPPVNSSPTCTPVSASTAPGTRGARERRRF